MKLHRSVVAACIVLLGTTPPVLAQQPAPQTSPFSVAPLVESVQAAVVSVEVVARAPSAPFRSPFGFGPEGGMPFEDFGMPPGGSPEQFRQGVGSGFIIDPAGWVVTNNHVVEGATAIRVRLHDEREFDADVRGRDPLTDVALLQLRGNVRNLPTVRLGDSEAVQIGDGVVAIGSPFGLSATVSAGILSAKARDIGAGPYDDFLQTDAAINPGNSGGPLFNMHGDVIGMNTAIVGGGAGIGFAVPSNLIRALLPQLRKEGVVTRGWLGLQLQELTPELATALKVPRRNGAIVVQVLPDSPAAAAGLRADDVITAANGQPVESAASLTRRVALLRPGQEVRLHVFRQGREMDVQVKLGTRPDFEGVAEAQPTPEQLDDSQQRYGITVSDVPPQISQQTRLPSRGALITQVRPASPAARAELEPGMVVVQVGETPVESAGQLVAALKRARSGQTLLLRVRVPGAEAALLRALVAP